MAVKFVTHTPVIPYILYRDVPAALEWLARALGFAERMRTQTPRSGTHGEMLVGDQLVMTGQGGSRSRMQSVSETKVATQGFFVYLAEADAHYERARAAGAQSDKPPEDLPYGRSYTVRDLEGHPWFFTTPTGGD